MYKKLRNCTIKQLPRVAGAFTTPDLFWGLAYKLLQKSKVYVLENAVYRNKSGMTNCRKAAGFTLVELAIVIVIIGLLVGGVLQGQELVKQAQARNNIKRMEEIKSAVANFYSKYNCIPGECTNGISLGLGANGDGDGMITYIPNGGIGSFWLHLVRAKMLTVLTPDGTPLTYSGNMQARFLNDKGTTFGMMYASYGDLYAGQTPGFPWSEPCMISNLNYNLVTIASQIVSALSHAAFTPEELRIVDEKMDDGNALTGKFYGANARLTDYTTVTNCNTSGIYSTSNTEIACRALFQLGL